MQSQKSENKTYSILQNIGFYFQFYKNNIPLFLWLCLIEIVLGSIAPYFGIYLPKLIVELVTKQYTVENVVEILGVFGILFVCICGAKGACAQGKYFLYNTKRSDLIASIFLKSNKIPYPKVEMGNIKDLYWKAIQNLSTGDWSAPYKMTYGTLNIVKNSISFMLYSTVLGYLNIWIVMMLIILSMIQYALSISEIKYMERFREKDAELDKKKSYLLYSAMGNQKAVKDIKIFSMKELLVHHKNEIISEIKNNNRKKAKVQVVYWQFNSLLALGRDLFAYIYLIIQTKNGVINAGEFVLYFGAITGFSVFINSIMSSIADMREGNIATNILRSYMELEEEDTHTGKRSISELQTPFTITFHDVSFRYESKWVFRHLNLTINAGEKIAIVGVNGVGKTTLVKLMCGLYEPNEGEILFNDIPMKEFSKEDIFKLYSAVFQEPFILPFSVGENLSLSKEYDKERCQKSIEEAGLLEVFKEKDITWNTYFGRDIDEKGIELSGGQTQRFLLARALYKDAPVLVLDEPTAALDPIAESEIYDEYAKFSKGKTAIFISHRLASTRFSNRIILLGNQGILEEGTHEELLAKNGVYAEMFEVQRSYYEENRKKLEAYE